MLMFTFEVQQHETASSNKSSGDSYHIPRVVQTQVVTKGRQQHPPLQPCQGPHQRQGSQDAYPYGVLPSVAGQPPQTVLQTQ